MKRLHRLACLAVMAAITGCLSAAGAQSGGAPRLEISWTVEVPETPVPLLAATESVLLIATPSGKLKAVDASTGAARWERLLEGAIATPPLAGPDRFAVVAGGSLHLIDPATGDSLAIREPVAAPCRLSIDAGQLAAACADGALLLVDLATGNPLWTRGLPGPATAPIAFCDDLLLAGTPEGSLSSLSRASGQTLWSRPLGGGVSGTPACRDGRAWIGTPGNRLYAMKIRGRRGNLLWSYRTGGDIAGSPRRIGDDVLFFSMDTWLYALHADNGHLAWRSRLGRRPRGDGALVGELFFVAPLNAERLEIFRLPGGTRAGSWDLEPGVERLMTAPVIASGGVAFGVARYGQETSRVVRLALAAER